MARRRALKTLFPAGGGKRSEGTRAFVLQPASIVTAAEADLLLRERQRGVRYDGDDRAVQPYCFHHRHVVRASCAFDLIDRAIKDRYSGVHSGKRITRIIYADEELLLAARAIVAIGEGAAA